MAHMPEAASGDERRVVGAMRVSVPTIPDAVLRAATAQNRQISPALAIERISTFLSNGKAAVITGAGVSVDSGIRAYRGEHGVYLNPNYKCVAFLLTLWSHFSDRCEDLYS